MTFLKTTCAALMALTISGAAASAATCGNTGAGFEAWKASFAKDAKKAGVKKKGLAALASASYATKTIAADRNQKSFKYTLDKFMKVRGAPTIVSQGRKKKAQNAALFAALEKRYGVPAGVILAIHGMETGFGGFMGNSPIVSAITTLTYDCRRSAFFKPHAIGALKLVDQGAITANPKGAKHGEWGHTQFLTGNALKYGVDANGDGKVDLNNVTDALASTANFLKAKGWKKGKGYQEGQPNFKAIKAWNAAGVYQKAIAIMAAQIDG
jgi:membrane-bound lytic murein transglycosylase B